MHAGCALPFPDLSPEIFSIRVLGFEIALRWYAMAYIVGILIGWRMVVAAVRRPRALARRHRPDDARAGRGPADLGHPGHDPRRAAGLRAVLPAGLLPAEPGRDPAIWQGGMSFHGGFLGRDRGRGGFCWRQWASGWPAVADLLAHGHAAGLLLGGSRISSMPSFGAADRRALGRDLSRRAAQDCPGVEGLCARHPSQLYEAGWRGWSWALVLIWLVWRRGALKRPGLVTGCSSRATGWRGSSSSSFRQPDAQFITPDNPLGLAWRLGGYGLTMGQVLSLPMLARGSMRFCARADAPDGMTPLADRICRQIAPPGRSPSPTTWRPACCIPSMATTPPATRWARRAISPPRPRSARCSASFWGCAWRRLAGSGRAGPFTLAELGPGAAR
jgi:phosphatidylglycerol:prolipoprotein diacylglycerol transferase